MLNTWFPAKQSDWVRVFCITKTASALRTDQTWFSSWNHQNLGWQLCSPSCQNLHRSWITNKAVPTAGELRGEKWSFLSLLLTAHCYWVDGIKYKIWGVRIPIQFLCSKQLSQCKQVGLDSSLPMPVPPLLSLFLPPKRTISLKWVITNYGLEGLEILSLYAAL